MNHLLLAMLCLFTPLVGLAFGVPLSGCFLYSAALLYCQSKINTTSGDYR